MTANKRRKKLKNKNNAVYVLEVLLMTAASVFLSVVSSAIFVSLPGLFCIAAASALFSCVLFLTKARALLPAAIISFAVTFILNGDIISAFASLLYIIAGAYIYFGVKSKKKRTQITVGIAAVLTALFAVMLVAPIISSAGMSINAIVSEIDSGLTEGIENSINQFFIAFPQYSGAPDLDAEQRAADFEKHKEKIIIDMKGMLPACFILYNLFIAYLSTALFKIAYNIFIPMANPNRKKIKNKYWRINVSVISAIIMIASVFMFLAVQFSGGDNILAYIVLKNLIYILFPGFCIMGIYLVYDKLFDKVAGIFPVILVAGAVIFAFVLQFALFVALVFFIILGLYAALISDLKKISEKAKKLMFGDDDDDDYID